MKGLFMKHKKKKYYVVVKGRKTGIFTEWFGKNGAEVQVKGFSNALHKGFYNRKEAVKWQRDMLNIINNSNTPFLSEYFSHIRNK